MNSDQVDLTFKILTIGESGVGKTCVLRRFTDGKFQKTHLATIGIDYKAKNINLNGKTIKLKMWDTAGQERFRSLGALYYKTAKGALVVFDITAEKSFQRAKEWISELHQNAEPDILISLVGNKVDLESDRKVSREV